MALYSLAFVLLLALTVESTQLYSWGVNDYGQLGVNGTVVYYPQVIPTYTKVNVVNLLASGTFHMAVTSNGDVYTCGNNWYGGLAVPVSTIFQGNPQLNPDLKNCTIYLGKRHGNAVCGSKFVGWGVQAGYVAGLTSGNWGRKKESLASYKLGSNVVNVTAGSRFSIVALNNGTMVVAGDGTGGILGLGDTTSEPNFVKFDAFHDIPLLKIFPSHADHVCAISTDYLLYCWGSNTVGQLGIGNTVNQSRPALVSFFQQEYYVVQVATGENHTLALTAGGRVFAWGQAASGVLGNGATDSSIYSTPVEIEFLADKNVVEVVAGLNFNFVRTATNQWYSWGAGTGGVLGTLKDADVTQPTLISLLSNFSITHILTASSSRSVYGWLDPTAPTAIVGPPLVDECLQTGKVVCKTNAHCQDTDRSAICVCDEGFQGDATNCTDINECLTPTVCVTGAKCTNTIGNYTCTCPPNKPIGDGRSTGTGCLPVPTLPPTKPPTPPPTQPPTQPPPNNSTSDSSTSGGAPTTSQPTSGSSNTSQTGGNGNSLTTGGTGASSNGTSTSSSPGDTTTGADTNPSSTTLPSSTSTTAASTSGRTNLYQTLFGSKDDIPIPQKGTSTTSDPRVISEGDASKRHEKNVVIGVVVGFGVLVAIALAVLLFVILRNRRPQEQ